MKVLLVEDDEIDVEAMRRGFRRSGVPHEIHVARNGEEALQVLLRDKASPKPLLRPFLIVLDLNMPRMNGVEFLEALRADDRLRDNVVFVLSTSDADRDKAAAYKHHVAGYLVKSPYSQDFENVTELLGRYWQTVELPPPSES